MRKSFIVFIMMFVMISSVALASQETIEVKLNDKYIDFTDSEGNIVEPALINDRTMVPMRKIFETLGANIEWDGATQKIVAKTDEKEITLQIDNNTALLENLESGETQNITLDAAPVILNNRTMVPVRFIAESLEKKVGWDSENKVVVIIDYNELMNDIKENCSTFMQMVQEQKTKIETFDLGTTIKGNLNYKDTEDSKNNQTISVNGKINVKKSENMAKIDLELKLSGKGVLMQSLKERGYNNITLNILVDLENNETYMKSSLLNSKKWTRTEYDIEKYLSTSIDTTEFNIEDAFELINENLNKDSYEQAKMTVDTIKTLLGNDKIKVDGKTTKTYTIKWNLEELLSNLHVNDNETINDLLSLGKVSVECASTFKNGMNTKSKVAIDASLQMKETKEKVTFNLSFESKYNSYNKKVTITALKQSEII